MYLTFNCLIFKCQLTVTNILLSIKKALILFLEYENSMQVDEFLNVQNQTVLVGGVYIRQSFPDIIVLKNSAPLLVLFQC